MRDTKLNICGIKFNVYWSRFPRINECLFILTWLPYAMFLLPHPCTECNQTVERHRELRGSSPWPLKSKSSKLGKVYFEWHGESLTLTFHLVPQFWTTVIHLLIYLGQDKGVIVIRSLPKLSIETPRGLHLFQYAVISKLLFTQTKRLR